MALQDNIISYWKLEDLTDSAGSSTLTNTGSVAFSAGKINSGAVFDGTNKRLSLGDANGFTAGGTFTWNCWIYPTNTTGCYYIDHITNSGAQRRMTLYLENATKTLRVYSWANDLNSNYTVSASTWFMATVTWNNGTITIYVNGIQMASGSTGTSAGSANSFSLGTNYDSFSSNATCIIDEFSFWSRVLSGPEIALLYNSGRGNPYPMLIAPSGLNNFMRVKGPGGSIN